MKMYSFFFMFILSTGFIFCLYFSNPAFLITWLVALSFMTGLIFLNTLNNWLMYAVVLLFTGGMMILFTYMTSLVVSSKVNFPPINKTVYLMIIPSLMLLSNQNFLSLEQKIISSIYLETMNWAVLFIAIYLLLILVSMVKIATSISGSFKSFFQNEK